MTALPTTYSQMDRTELEERISRCKRTLGERLVILGHHYQRDEVIQFADHTGDSLRLARIAREQEAAQYVVFCGVRFMAESADIVAGGRQVVCLPNLAAGCTMSDMAADADVEAALEELTAMSPQRLIPITYVNSSATTKAITARYGGACCTSSNVRNVFDWALRAESKGGAGAVKLLCLPDQHLARNVAVLGMGRSLDECAVYDPALPEGGLTPADVERATFLLWKGHCYVHQFFTPAQVEALRAKDPQIRIIVHPESPHEVVRIADAYGSTEQIIRTIRAAEPGSRWAIGTESNLVERLAAERSDCEIRVLSDRRAQCQQMSMIDLPHLAWILEGLVEGQVRNQIRVGQDVAAEARLALDRMLAIPAATR